MISETQEKSCSLVRCVISLVKGACKGLRPHSSEGEITKSILVWESIAFQLHKVRLSVNLKSFKQ